MLTTRERVHVIGMMMMIIGFLTISSPERRCRPPSICDPPRRDITGRSISTMPSGQCNAVHSWYCVTNATSESAYYILDHSNGIVLLLLYFRSKFALDWFGHFGKANLSELFLARRWGSICIASNQPYCHSNGSKQARVGVCFTEVNNYFVSRRSLW